MTMSLFGSRCFREWLLISRFVPVSKLQWQVFVTVKIRLNIPDVVSEIRVVV